MYQINFLTFKFLTFQLFFTFCMGQGGYGGGRGSGMQGGKSGGGISAGRGMGTLPPGYANIHGEIMDITNKLLQRVTQVGTNYYSYENQNGAPVFKRREVDSGRRFVLFPDINFPPGDGHYVVLRKMPGVNIPGMIPQPLYEAFQLSLGDSIHGFVTSFNSQQYTNTADSRGGNTGGGGQYGAATSGYGAGNRRSKRKLQEGKSNFEEGENTATKSIESTEKVVVDDHSNDAKKRSLSVVTLQKMNVAPVL